MEFVTDPNYPKESVTFENFKDHFYDTGVYQVQWQKARDLKQRHPYMGKMSFPENMAKPSRTIMATLERLSYINRIVIEKVMASIDCQLSEKQLVLWDIL